jgi:ubiquinone/menaquinone biosynthesis C-methylase UbiE
MVAQATELAQESGLTGRVRFEQGDAERLRFADGTFDAIICECAFCTFPDKAAAAVEFARVLRPGGRVGLSDLTRNGPLPSELETLLAWIACIADARPVGDYISYLEDAGFVTDRLELHNSALVDLVKGIRTGLLGAELLVKLRKIDLLQAEFEEVKALARGAADSVQRGRLGYALILATKAMGA